jgi:hypothetical protein
MGFHPLTYAQKRTFLATRPMGVGWANSALSEIFKSLISLNFLSCTLDVQINGRLDFQGFREHPSEFSPKLSTVFLDQAQSTFKSMTYAFFQESS